MVDFKKLGLESKRAHVMAATMTRPHDCHAEGCEVGCKPAFFMCPRHWFMVPKSMRDAIWREYSLGQEQGLARVTPAYLKITNLAIEYIAEKEGRRMAGKKGSGSTALAKWDEELAKQAEVAQAMEASTATGQFFSVKGGTLMFNDAPIPGNQMAVIIIDSLLENVYYEGAYDPDSPAPVHCYAFGREEKTLAPHKDVLERKQGQHESCSGCPQNEFGTAEKGKGKACKNTRRLALIPAGTLDPRSDQFTAYKDAKEIEKAGVGYLRLPVTSIKGYSAFVTQVAGALRRPPHGIVTKVKVTPDPKTQFKVTFEPIEKVPDHLMGAVMQRHNEAGPLIEFPYNLDEREQEAPKKKGGKAAKRKY